jgi:hypothetical protein
LACALQVSFKDNLAFQVYNEVVHWAVKKLVGTFDETLIDKNGKGITSTPTSSSGLLTLNHKNLGFHQEFSTT